MKVCDRVLPKHQPDMPRSNARGALSQSKQGSLYWWNLPENPYRGVIAKKTSLFRRMSDKQIAVGRNEMEIG